MSSFFSVEQFNVLFGQSRDAVFFMEKVGQDYRYVHVNEAATKLINMNPTGKIVSQVVSPHVAKNILHYYHLTIDSKEQMEFEDYTYAEMEVRKQRTTAMPVFENDGAYILAITKEVSMNRDIEDKYLFMRSVFFNSFLSTVLVSNDFMLLESNVQFAEDFSLLHEHSKEHTIFDMSFLHPETAPLLKQYLLKAQKGENITSKMLKFIDKDGHTRYYTATFSSLTSNDEIFAVLIILQEITDFIHQSRALKTASHSLKTFKDALSSVADIIFTDVHGTIIDVNERVIQNTGYSREELLGQQHSIFNSGHHDRSFFEKLWRMVKQGKVWRDEVCNRKKNGELYWMDSTVIPLRNEFGELDQFLTVQYNISSKKKLMSELYKIEQTFRTITENTNDFIVMTNHLGEIIYASPSYARKLGYQDDELVGMPYERLLTSESKELWRRVIQQSNSAVQEQKIELQLRTKENKTLWTEGNYTISVDLLNMTMFEMVMVSREITERKELENRLTYLAYHDSLTQLGNRRKLSKAFPDMVERAKLTNTGLALFYLDGDRFKQVNDQFGHDVGDEFLKHFGQALVNSVNHDDLVIRLGGDEFLIVVADLSLDVMQKMQQIEHVVAKIKGELLKGWTIRGHHFSPTTTMGISIYPDHSEQLEELVDLADRALYGAKENERNSFRISQKLSI